MKTSKNVLVWIPLIIAISIVGGILIGNKFSSQKYISNNDRKLNTILNLISSEYVDTVDIDSIIEKSIPKILNNLDPHTTYISASEVKAVNDDLDGSFSGIGISFSIFNDTVTVIEIISGGPAEKAGLLAGDRIVSVDKESLIAPSNEVVMKKLKGAKSSTVKLGIKRVNSSKIYSYSLKRDNIPVTSIDASYMVEKGVGYIKVNKFGKNTYDDFISNAIELKKNGAKKFIIDLRGNGGGYMESAILIANEFLPENQLIVFTRGREKNNNQQLWSDGNGSFKEEELVLLLDEYSASASEIFAGAIQDNDRGLIIGRRSFGKGLVQHPISLPDSSVIRLTVARYYTPSGRCIQKNFKPGEESTYEQELYERYVHGELYNSDSIKVDPGKLFTTTNGRVVYGGGGIVPDLFVPSDTMGITTYYVKVINQGLLQKFSFQYTDINRNALSKMVNYNKLLNALPSDDVLLSDFVAYAAQNGIPARWYYINLSRALILNQLKALIARDVFGNTAFYPIYNKKDKNISEALNAFKKKKAAFPIAPPAVK